MEYLYLSSEERVYGEDLQTSLGYLQNRIDKTTGQIIVRGIKYTNEGKYQNYFYQYAPIEFDHATINTMVTRRNWAICWDPTFNKKN